MFGCHLNLNFITAPGYYGGSLPMEWQVAGSCSLCSVQLHFTKSQQCLYLFSKRFSNVVSFEEINSLEIILVTGSSRMRIMNQSPTSTTKCHSPETGNWTAVE
uniref:Uncharacterized protein n=1 Tax=Physcomitrium patens TaxID=3218 RepID=A0A2K1KIZ7_PHYPA|nr:hypothetical protein PHYPA_007431 [Physcomitrium patens]